MGYLNDECFSEHDDRSKHHARYFTFRLHRDYEVTLNLEGVPDPDKEAVSVEVNCGWHSECYDGKAPGDGLDFDADHGDAVYVVLKRIRTDPESTYLLIDTYEDKASSCWRPRARVKLPRSGDIVASFDHVHLEHKAWTPMSVSQVLVPSMDATAIWRLGEIYHGTDLCNSTGPHLHMGALRNHWRGSTERADNSPNAYVNRSREASFPSGWNTPKYTGNNPDPAPTTPGFGMLRAYSRSSMNAENELCISSNAPWQWQIASSLPDVLLSESPTASCPPEDLKLSKETHESLTVKFEEMHAVAMMPQPRAQVELYESTTRDGFCEPAYEACASRDTQTATAVTSTSVTFSNLTLNNWYQARGRGCTGSLTNLSCGSWTALTKPFQLTEPGLTPPRTPTLTVEPDNRLTVNFTRNDDALRTDVVLYRCASATDCTSPVLVQRESTTTGTYSFPPQDGGNSYTTRARSCIANVCGTWAPYATPVPLARQALVLKSAPEGTGTVDTDPPSSTRRLYSTGAVATIVATDKADAGNTWEWQFLRWDVTDAHKRPIATSNQSTLDVTMDGVRIATATFVQACTSGSGADRRRQSCTLPTPPDSEPEFPADIALADREFTFIQNAASTDVAVQHAIGGNEPVAYTLSGKPAGLSLDYDADGNPPLKLTGTATALQSKTKHTLTATDADGETDTLDVYITVVAPRPKVAQDLTGFAYTPAAMTYGAPDPVLTAPSGAVGTLTYEVTPASESVCTVVETTGALTIDTAGTCTVTALAAATTTHLAGTATAAVEVEKATPDLAFSYDPDDPKVDDPNPTLEPPADSHLDLEYSATPESVCTVNSTTGALTIEGAGECTITVSFDGSNTHEAGSDEAEVVVSKYEPDLSFSYSPRSITYGDPTPTLTPPTVESGVGALRYRTTSSDVCRVGLTTGALTIDGGGTCEVTLTSEETRTHEAGSAAATVTVAKRAVVLSFSYSPRSITYGDPTPTLNPPTVESGVGALRYQTTSSDVCRVGLTTGALTIRGGGTCEVSLTYEGTNSHHPGSAEAEVTVVKAKQTLTGFSYSPRSVEIDQTASPTGPDGAVGRLSYSASSECSVDSGGVVTGVSVGTCVVTVTAAMTNTHNAGSTTATVTVTRPAKVPQPLTGFSYSPSTAKVGSSPTLNEPTGAVGALKYTTTTTDVCSISNASTGALTLSAPGMCTVNATAAETDTHLEGTASTSLTVGWGLTLDYTVGGGTLTADPSKTVYGHGDTVTVTASANDGFVIRGWGGDCSSVSKKDTECSLTMNGHRTAVVTFDRDVSPAFALTEKRYHTIVGKQVSQLLPGATGGNGDLTYSLSGDLPPGMSFSSSTRRVTGAATSSAAGKAYWSTLTVEDCDGDTDTLRIRIYIKNLFDLTILISPRDTGTATGAGRHNEDDEVSISADPEDGWAFEEWTGTGIDDTDASSTTVLMDADKVITANFLNICDNNPGSRAVGRAQSWMSRRSRSRRRARPSRAGPRSRSRPRRPARSSRTPGPARARSRTPRLRTRPGPRRLVAPATRPTR